MLDANASMLVLAWVYSCPDLRTFSKIVGHERIKVDTITCKTCKASKPRSNFRRYASLAQTRSWLKNPNAQRRTLYYGVDCNACHSKAKRKLRDIRPSELQRRLVSEGKSLEFVDIAVTARILEGRKRASDGGRKGIKVREAPQFEALMLAANKFIAKVAQRRGYDMKRYRRDASIEFLSYTLAQARLARDKIREKKRKGKHAPDSWQEVVPEYAREKIRHYYKALSGNMKERYTWVLTDLAPPRVEREPSAKLNLTPAQWDTAEDVGKPTTPPDWLLLGDKPTTKTEDTTDTAVKTRIEWLDDFMD